MASQLIQTRLKALAVGLAVVVLAAGCQSQEPQPKMPDPTAEPTTAEPPPTPSEDQLAIPAAVRKPNKAGAEAAIRHYFEMFNYFIKSGDAAPVRKLYGERCSLCEVPIGVMELAQSKGHTYSGLNRIESLRVSMLGKDIAVGFVDASQTKIIERDGSGEVVNRFPAAPEAKFEYYTVFQRGMWEITNAESVK